MESAGGRPRESFAAAITVGGDVDTICAMTGALVGALWGAEALAEAGLYELDDAGARVVLRAADAIATPTGRERRASH